MLDIDIIETTDLGDRSYLVSDGRVAAIIDPQRDIDRILRLAEARDVTISHVLETHIHNDYLTGGWALARETGAEYCVAAADDVAFERRPIEHGESIAAGSLSLQAVHTPGHTPHHLSYLVHAPPPTSVDHDLPPGRGPVAVFTGGSLLYGSVGRTDLIDPASTDELTRRQYRSARTLGELPGHVEVWPTHGFGSFCSSGDTSGAHSSTIGQEQTTNPALLVDDEDRFVRELLAGLTEHPSYYTYMAPRNRRGPEAPDLSPAQRLDAAELRARIRRGEWVVDLRARKAFADRHLSGTISMEAGDSFVTYLGWLVPWGTPVTLVGEDADQVAAAQRSMARIGIDRPAGRAVGELAAWSDGEERSYPVTDFSGLAPRIGDPDVHVLDVRRRDEWQHGHVVGAANVPLHELEDRIGEVPNDRQWWVHCRSGYRAAIAASLLDRRRTDVVLIDDEFERAAAAGVPVDTA